MLLKHLAGVPLTVNIMFRQLFSLHHPAQFEVDLNQALVQVYY